MDRARLRYEADTGRASVHVSEATPFVFRYLLEEAFVGNLQGRERIQFHIVGSGEYTVSFDSEEVEVEAGWTGEPTARLVTSRETFGGMTLFKVMAASSAAQQRQQTLGAEVGRELSDHQLASVAGGKGRSGDGCWSDTGCGGDILVVGCRSNYDGCAGDYCASAGCGIDGCAGAACGADYGGGGGCAADGCIGAACGADACGTAGCGAAGCAADACYQDLCGAAACGADACGAAICGADACAVDACLIDFIPGVPFV
ncbi:Cys-every-fifth RiPP peptide CefA [Sphingomonas qomolangmaensis]|uniref:Cys-every-fifth RiPP peptide CefA n=1 Tax=Sphingomonas qomolangmaensis TaxID=2918765 RepID=A0ABY5LAN1_9SPHN|nr:Cys-every-fifth RiPP peptide CefA [Sphingomonas qomolangmaensis]UUL84024.1 Cys-every-fifth RiPP peptide CefA [Sphingomonas qomolangmaensis]